MKLHQTRYAITAAFGSIATSMAVIAFPQANFSLALAGSVFVGLMCGIVALGDS